jgi:hypothetical protein
MGERENLYHRKGRLVRKIETEKVAEIACIVRIPHVRLAGS